MACTGNTTQEYRSNLTPRSSQLKISPSPSPRGPTLQAPPKTTTELMSKYKEITVRSIVEEVSSLSMEVSVRGERSDETEKG